MSSDGNLIDIYRIMFRIRLVEEELARRYPEQEMRCPVHLCIGQEAVAAGVCAALRREDVVFSNHRAHGHYLAKGGDLRGMIAEIYGKETGCCGGRGGSMHLVDNSAGFGGSTAIVGGTVPIAVGAAWASKLEGRDNIAAVFFGDGCFEEGVLHESMNFAAMMRLPVLFICENNGYAVYTGVAERQPKRPIYQVARAHGLEAQQEDGNDAEAVFRIAATAVKAAREGGGPQFLELRTFRSLEHCGPESDDHLGYRAPEEVSYWRGRCPIALAKARLVEQGWQEKDLEALMEPVREEINLAFQFARESPAPIAASAWRGLYGR